MASSATDVLRQLKRTMAKHPEIVCLLFALLFTYMHRVTKSAKHPVTAHQPPPRRFFPAASHVLDFPYGNIADVGRLQQDYEVLFVMYYAPWCAKSKRVKKEFEKAAQYLQNEVQFVAINCWYPHGQCRQQNSFAGFPELYFYHTHLSAFKYKGILRADFMVNFVDLMLHPFVYLQNQLDVASFLAMCDNSLIGFFDFNSSPQPPGFMQFYYATMRSIEAEPNSQLNCHGVFTDASLAYKFSMLDAPSVSLVRIFNGTLRYPTNRNFTASALTRWYFLLKQPPVVQWILPSGSKSNILSSEVSKGPAVILFTHAYPLSEINVQFSQLRDIALHYMNCKNASHIHDITQRSSYLRWATVLHLVEKAESCQEHKKRESAPFVPPTKSCCLSLFSGAHNSCSACLNYQATHPVNAKPCPLLSHSQVESSWLEDITFSPLSDSCSESMQNYNPSEYVSVCCHSTGTTEPFSHNYNNHFAKISKEHQLRDSIDSQCHKYHSQRLNGWQPSASVYQQLQDIVFPANFNHGNCFHNRTLNFYAMDSSYSGAFAERLGLHQTNSSALLILDIQNEEQNSLEGPVSSSSIMELIYNYSRGELRHSLRSHHHQTSSKCNNQKTGFKSVCVQDITWKNFNQIVMDNSKDVVLYYYTSWCGFCSGFSHVFLSLAKYFQSAKNLVFIRLNADSNDLPWEFTPDVYPTISLYPAKKKSESVSFPDHMEKSLSNLIQFVKDHSSMASLRDLNVMQCSAECMKSAINAALRHLQDLEVRSAVLLHRAENMDTQKNQYYHHHLLKALHMFDVLNNSSKSLITSLDDVLTYTSGKSVLLKNLKRDFKSRAGSFKAFEKLSYEKLVAKFNSRLST